MRLNAKALAISVGILWGASVFLATVWLVITGSAGITLGKLSAFYVGYSVSWGGAFVGLEDQIERRLEALDPGGRHADAQAARGLRIEEDAAVRVGLLVRAHGAGECCDVFNIVVAKIKEAFFTFDWAGSDLKKEFKKEDKFISIHHKSDWDVIRKIDAANGVKYDCK